MRRRTQQQKGITAIQASLETRQGAHFIPIKVDLKSYRIEIGMGNVLVTAATISNNYNTI